MEEQKRTSLLQAGLIAGAVLGLAAGFFLQSRKGKQFTKDAQKKATLLQKQIMKKLQSFQEMTKERYLEVVDDVLDYYAKTKEVANSELPEVRKYLVSRWKDIKTHFEQ